MGRKSPTGHLPPEVIARTDFAEACANRDLGKVLRLAKKWGGPGFTASHLARQCELTVSRVQDYINGRVQAQHVEVFVRVAEGLHIPGAMLDLAPRSWEEQSGQSSPTRDSPSAGQSGEDNKNGDSSVIRRDAMKFGTGGVAAVLVGTTPSASPRISANRVGSSSVEELRRNITRLRRLDDHLGGADTYRLYRAEVDKTAALLKQASASADTKRDLLSIFAEQTQQAGWAAFDAGWHQQAEQLYDRSFNAAQEAGDRALMGNALAFRSYQLLSTETMATELTDKSCAIAADEGIHPAVKALLYERGAWTYAVTGKIERVSYALGQAEEALAQQHGGNPAPDWAAWAADLTELQIMTGRCWTHLHRPLRAVPALEAALAYYDDSHARDKALYLSWLADAYFDAGEIEHAAAVLGQAMGLATDVASVRPQQRINAVLIRLVPYKSLSAVTELFARGPLNPLQIRG